MKLSCEITEAIVLRGFGTDTILLKTNLPGAVWPFSDGEPLSLKFDAAKGTGEEYLLAKFGIVDNVIYANGDVAPLT